MFLQNIFSKNKYIFLSKINKISAIEIAKLRKDLNKEKIHIQVIKNKIAKIAIRETKMKSLIDDFSQSTMIIWSNINFINTAKILVNAQKEKNITIWSGYFEKERVDSKKIKIIAKTPSLNTSRSQMVNFLELQGRNIINQVNSPLRSIVHIIQKKF